MNFAFVFIACIKISLKIYILFYAIVDKNSSNKCPLVEWSLSARQIELDSTNFFYFSWRIIHMQPKDPVWSWTIVRAILKMVDQ